jgi:hypothetical protein
MTDEKKNRGQPLAVQISSSSLDLGGWRTEKVTVQKRGIRENVSVQYFDKTGKLDLQLTAAQARLNGDPIDHYDRLFRRANELLKARGEKTYFEALQDYSFDFDGESPVDPGSFAVLLWCSDIGTRYGTVSAEAMAARFLMLADAICMRACGDEKTLRETFAFARSWHEWQAEVDGEHVSASQAVSARANLQKAAPNRTAKKAERLMIVREEAEKLWQKKPNYRSKSDSTAQSIFEAVNRRFGEVGLGTYTLPTLIKAVGTLLKH